MKMEKLEIKILSYTKTCDPFLFNMSPLLGGNKFQDMRRELFFFFLDWWHNAFLSGLDWGRIEGLFVLGVGFNDLHFGCVFKCVSVCTYTYIHAHTHYIWRPCVCVCVRKRCHQITHCFCSHHCWTGLWSTLDIIHIKICFLFLIKL